MDVTRTAGPDRSAATASIGDRLVSWLRDLWAGQCQLHRSYVNRYVVSGQESVRAMHALHWSGDQLVGEFLPEAGDRSAHRMPGDDSDLWR